MWFPSVLGEFLEDFVKLVFSQLNITLGVYAFVLLHYIVGLHFIFFSLEKQNQSMRGNGRKQYQDSPNQKKRTNGVHSQPAKQQNPLMVRLNSSNSKKAVHPIFRSGARALSKAHWIDILIRFYGMKLCIICSLKISDYSVTDLSHWFSCTSDFCFFMWVFKYFLLLWK